MQINCNLEHVPEVYIQSEREGVKRLPAQRGERQEEGTVGSWLSSAMPGDAISPSHNPDNCSILCSDVDGGPFLTLAEFSLKASVSRCGQKG